MSQYRKKPVIIEAWSVKSILNAAEHEWKALPQRIIEAYEKGEIIFIPDAILIQTREGEMQGDFNDIIIQGIKGELYPCKADIFEATYGKVEVK